MTDLDITRVRVYAVTPDTTPTFKFAGTREPVTLHHIIVRLSTRGGVEGVAGAFPDQNATIDANDDCVGDSVNEFRPLIGTLVGQSVLRREAISAEMLAACSATIPYAESLLDMAMWDAYAHSRDEPLYRLLGADRARIPAYACSPVFDTVDEYLDYIRVIADMGYPAVKFHTQCDLDFDLEMVTTVTAALQSTDLRFMVDLEQAYDFDSAVELGRALAQMPCEWLEAPFRDELIDNYAELRRAVDVEVIPDGDVVIALPDMADAITRGAWSRLRCDPTCVGGISAVCAAMELGRTHGMKTELQSYGYPLIQFANLQIMLGVPGCSYFEQPVPLEHYDYACLNPVRIDDDGCVGAPDGPGLGLLMDWNQIERDAMLVLDTE
jgi:L-alanine-DL-glutamate epimerase-like enolase superfamily enzyme